MQSPHASKASALEPRCTHSTAPNPDKSRSYQASRVPSATVTAHGDADTVEAPARQRSDGKAESSLAASVGRLFVENNAALLRFISAKVGSEQEAREIAQDAYVHLLGAEQHEAISYLRAFLYKAAANLVVDRLRQQARRTHVTSMPEVDFAVFELTPERQISGEQALLVMMTAVSQLPPKCRTAFLLRHSNGLSVAEISVRMNIGECMVRRYIARGIVHIRDRLDAEGYELGREVTGATG